MIKVGEYNYLTAIRSTPQGVYLDDEETGILLPIKQVPKGIKEGDVVNVFIYHDSENRLIATTETPKGILGDIVELTVLSVTPSGAYLDFGLIKDLFLHKSQMAGPVEIGEKHWVKIILDDNGRLAATENLKMDAGNSAITVKEHETVELIILKETDLGYNVLINRKHLGLLHFSDIFKHVMLGDKLEGHIKKIRMDNKIDVAEGKHGYERIESELDKVIRLLEESNGFLPFHDKSDPEDIYAYFSMSKKTFKQVVGSLYKQRIITIEKDGIRLV